MWVWIWRVLTVAVIPWAAWMTMWTVNISERLARIEETALRAHEAQSIWRKLDRIEERLENHVEHCEEMVKEVMRRSQ